MQVDTVSVSPFDLGPLKALDGVAELLARESVTLIESEAFGCGTGVFAYQAAGLDGIVRRFVGVLMLDESVALLSLSSREATRIADLIQTSAAAQCRITYQFPDNRPVAAVDALGFAHETEDRGGPGHVAVDALRVEDGHPVAGVGIWYETGDDLDQPGDDGFRGGYTAFALDQVNAVVAALRAAS